MIMETTLMMNGTRAKNQLVKGLRDKMRYDITSAASILLDRGTTRTKVKGFTPEL